MFHCIQTVHVKSIKNAFMESFVAMIDIIRSNFDLAGETSDNFYLFYANQKDSELNFFEPTRTDEWGKNTAKSSKKFSALDLDPANLLGMYLDTFLPIITNIVNLSLDTCWVPLSLK